MILRERSVYDIVTLIAEVSGFADMFMISATVLLTAFYQPKMLESALLKHMNQLLYRRKKLKMPDLSGKIKPGDKDLLKLVILEIH
jgi:hypothetical protein